MSSLPVSETRKFHDLTWKDEHVALGEGRGERAIVGDRRPRQQVESALGDAQLVPCTPQPLDHAVALALEMVDVDR